MTNAAGRMMAKQKAASLTSALLSVKGAAMPSSFSPAIAPAPRRALGSASARLTFVSADAASAAKKPRPPRLRAAKKPDDDGAERKGTGAEHPADQGARVKASVKLDPQTHRRLRVASVLLDRSMQEILVDALARYLDDVAPSVRGGDCPCLAVPKPGVPRQKG